MNDNLGEGGMLSAAAQQHLTTSCRRCTRDALTDVPNRLMELQISGLGDSPVLQVMKAVACVRSPHTERRS